MRATELGRGIMTTISMHFYIAHYCDKAMNVSKLATSSKCIRITLVLVAMLCCKNKQMWDIAGRILAILLGDLGVIAHLHGDNLSGIPWQ